MAIPKGTTVILDLAGVNMDEDIWGADAKVWRPERWLENIPESVAKSHVPSAYSHMLVVVLIPLHPH